MGWNLYLVEDGETVSVPTRTEGGVLVAGGSDLAEINVTWNYSRLFYFPDLNGLTGAESVAVMAPKLAEYGTVRSASYWEATPGNVGAVLSVLISWANLYPNAVWVVR